MPKGLPSEGWSNQYGMPYKLWRREMERRALQKKAALAARRRMNKPWGTNTPPPPPPYITQLPGTSWVGATTVTGVTAVFPQVFPNAPQEFPTPKIEDLGTAIEPIVGYRMFSLIETAYGIQIQSGFNALWPFRKPLRANCQGSIGNMIHDAPDPLCSCGIYAWDAKNENQVGHSSIRGEVYLWGKVLLCPLGYRAEFAYPKVLRLFGEAKRQMAYVAKELEENYGVPVEWE